MTQSCTDSTEPDDGGDSETNTESDSDNEGTDNVNREEKKN